MERSTESERPPPAKRQRLSRPQNAQPNNLMSSVNSESSSRFLRLPGEIRNQIYEECLVVNGTINPHPTNYQDNRVVPEGHSKPLVALLGVSKQVKKEAESILYGENTWLHNQQCTKILQNTEEHAAQPFWDNLLHQQSPMKHLTLGQVIIEFTYRDFNQELLGPLYTKWRRTRQLLAPQIPQMTSLEAAHILNRKTLYNTWMCKIQVFLDLMIRSLPPSKVILDFTDCYCNSGCCRPVVPVIGIMTLDPRYWGNVNTNTTPADRAAYLERLSTVEIDVVGLLDDEEVKYVKERSPTTDCYFQES
ncbi:MAG: hypothetical protein Q9168_007932 [Polycauliona sp. 1 TL-2023]